MAESSLSIGLPDLKSQVGFYLGYGRGVDTPWNANQLAEILGVVQSGVRRVYYPPSIPQLQVQGYEWSWLRPNEFLSIYGRYNTGTIGIVSGVVTLIGGVFPSWSASGYLVVVNAPHQGQVASRDSDTQITLVDTTVNVPTGTAYSIGQFAYNLPDNFGRLVGTFHYPEAAYRHTIQVIPASRLLDMYAYSNLTDDPTYAAIRYKPCVDESLGGQRQEVLFFPTPTAPWTYSYEYEAYSGQLTDSFPYPLGGMQLAELYIESCLAVAESRINDEVGQHSQQFALLLSDAVARDRKRGAQRYGAMGHHERDYEERFYHGYTGPPYPIEYHGEMI